MGMQDWPSWSQTGGDYDQYKSYVARSLETQCLAAWTPVAERHRSKIPYCAFQAGPGGVLEELRRGSATWSTMLAVRGWCRARAGYILVRRTSPQHGVQLCIFCGRPVTLGMAHVIGQCDQWGPNRQQVLASMPQPPPSTLYLIARAVPRCSPAEPHFQDAVRFMDELDQTAMNTGRTAPCYAHVISDQSQPQYHKIDTIK